MMYDYFEVEVENEVVVATCLKPSLADDDVVPLGEEMVDIIEKSDGKIVVDFSATTHASSAVLGKLTVVNKVAKQAKAKFALCKLSTSVRESMQSTHLDQIIKVCDTKEEAIAWENAD